MTQPDDGRRYHLTLPASHQPATGPAQPQPRPPHRAVTVHGSADLARHLTAGADLGVSVAWRQLDQDPTDDGGPVVSPIPAVPTVDTDPAAPHAVYVGCPHPAGAGEIGGLRATTVLRGAPVQVRICWPCRFAQQQSRGGAAA